jgi:hypothetical protein
MTTVAELAAREHVECAYLLVWQGVPFCFTNRPEIAGTAWIGEDSGRLVLEGLDVRGSSIAYATEMQQGKPDTDDSLSVKIVDFDRELIAFFRHQPDAVAVGGRLSPTDDPAPAFLIGKSGDNVPIHGKWVNTEAIGLAGERSQFSIFPDGDACGLDHAAYLGDIDSLALSLVFDAPTHLEGRRAALYRVYQDPDTGEWPSWSDQHASGASLLWVGVLTNDISVEDKTWTINMEGPSAWLRRQLGSNRPTEWLPVSGAVTLNTTPGQREDLIALKFWYQQVLQPAPELGGSSIFTALDVLPPTGVASDYRSAINARISTVSATAADITWTTARNASASVEQGYILTRIDQLNEAANFVRAACWSLAAHDRVFRALGFAPELQQATNYDTSFEVSFIKAEETDLPVPGPGYWVATFWTVPVGFNSVNAAGADADNSGKYRAVQALGPEDITMLTPQAGFELRFGVNSPPFLEAQTNRAPVEYALSGGLGTADAQGYVAFRGSYQDSLDGEATTMVQLAQVCFKRDSSTYGGDTIELDSDGAVRVAVTKWIDGRFHGIDRRPLDHVWLSQDLEYCWVNLLGYNFGSGDYAHRLLARTLPSTGTASWSGFDGQGAVLTPGVNHPTALDDIKPMSDAEISDLGLAIPHSLIDLSSFGKAANSLPFGGMSSPLNKCRYAWVGAQDSETVIASILAPRGWGLGFCNGRWRLFSRPDVLTGDDVEVVLGPDDFVGDPELVETAELRPFTPRESFSVDFSRALVSEGATEDKELTLTARSQDPASRTRADNGQDDIEGWGLIPLPLWRGEGVPADWRPAWTYLFARLMAGWFNAPHVLIAGLRIVPSKARLLGPGSVVRFSSHYAATREGTYGPVGKLGRVYRVEHDLESREGRIDVLLQPGDETQTRFLAPIAVLVDDVSTVEGRWDVTTRTATCKQDAFGHGVADLHDVSAFAEPSWLGIGGDALVHVWQWNGRAWSLTCSFLVESVSAGSNTITWKAGSLTPGFKDSRYTCLVLAPYDDQPSSSWTRAYFSVLTRSDFKLGSVPTQGWPLS